MRDLRRRWPWRITGSISWRTLQSSRRQPPACLKLRIPLAIGGRPPAVRLPRCELAGIPIVIEALDQAVDPAETQCRIDSVVVGDGWAPRLTLVEYEPHRLSLIHISEPTRLGMISYAVFCLK